MEGAIDHYIKCILNSPVNWTNNGGGNRPLYKMTIERLVGTSVHTTQNNQKDVK